MTQNIPPLSEEVLAQVKKLAEKPEVKAAMEQAPMIYPEEVSPQEQAEQNQNLQKQIHEITQDIKEVKKTTVVRQETLTEQQKEMFRKIKGMN